MRQAEQNLARAYGWIHIPIPISIPIPCNPINGAYWVFLPTYCAYYANASKKMLQKLNSIYTLRDFSELNVTLSFRIAFHLIENSFESIHNQVNELLL